MDEVLKEFSNKSIMKKKNKNDKRKKPIIYENIQINQYDVNEIIARYSFDSKFKQYYIMKLNSFQYINESF